MSAKVAKIDRAIEDMCRDKRFLDCMKETLDAFDSRAYHILSMRLGHIPDAPRTYRKIGERLWSIVANGSSKKFIDRPLSEASVSEVYANALREIKINLYN